MILKEELVNHSFSICVLNMCMVDSSVCVIYHYMGDKLDAVESSEVAEVRAIVNRMP